MKPKLPRGTLDRLWSDPVHWRGFFYSCGEDPRVIVPKRNRRLGWTLNMAHRAAVLRCIGAFAVMFVVMGSAGFSRNPYLELGAAFLVLLVTVVSCHRLADTERFED